MNVATEYRVGVFALTGICGLIDVACFVAIGGVFAELMTGNLLLVGISIGTRQFDPSTAALYASAIVPFLLGAFAAGLLTNRRPSHGPRIIGYPVEYVCIVTGTAIAVLTHPTQITTPGLYQASDGYLLQRLAIIGFLAFAMGIHNAIMRKHGVPDIATNVMTLTLAGLVAESRLAGGPATHWQRRLTSVGIFIAGAAFGAWLLRFGVAAPLVAASAIFTIALYPLMKGRNPHVVATLATPIP